MTADEIRAALTARAPDVCAHLFPAGRRVGDEYEIGSLAGEEGRSLRINLNGKVGAWSDFATGDKGGNLLELWHRARDHDDFRATMREAAEWCGSPARWDAGETSDTDDIPAGHPKWHSRPAGRWIYRDADGKPWLVTYRYETSDGGKAFFTYDCRARKWIERGEHRLPDRRPLYRLNAFAHQPAREIVLVEGEKCADALTGLGVLSTSTLGGAGQVRQADFSSLRGWTVRIWPDADEAGRKYAETAAAMMREAGAEPMLVPVPAGKADGWDVADAIAEGWGVEEIRAALSCAASGARDDSAATQELAEPAASGPRVVTLDELLAYHFPPREDILRPALPRQGLAMLHAWRGLGKTYLTLAIALAIAAGGKLLKWEASRPWRVLFVDGEMPGVILQERIAKLAKPLCGRIDPAFLRIITPDLQRSGIPDIGTERGQCWLDSVVEDADVLILDNLSSLVRTGSENADELWLPMSTWLLRQRAAGRAAVLVHHDGKGEKQRGVSRREDLLDTVIQLRKPHDYKESDGARFVLSYEKHRGFYGPDAEPIEARLVEGDAGLEWAITELEDARTLQVAELLRDGSTVTEISKALGGIGRATVDRHKKKAIEKGLYHE